MAIKVLSLAENGYRRLANAITVTILMHTTFSPLIAGPFSAFSQQLFKPFATNRAIFVFFLQQFFKPLQQTDTFEMTFPPVSVLR